MLKTVYRFYTLTAVAEITYSTAENTEHFNISSDKSGVGRADVCMASLTANNFDFLISALSVH